MPTIIIPSEEFVDSIIVEYSSDTETWSSEMSEDSQFMRLRSGDSILYTSSFKKETPQTEGQRHLELDETTLETTGKSVDIDEVLSKIDDALDTDKE